jgi:hypothetical protein
MQSMGMNIEIKMATSAALSHTPTEEVQRVVDPIMATLLSAQTCHTIAMSSFDPEVMSYVAACSVAVRAHYPTLSAWFLSAGEHETLREDARRRTVAAAIAFAGENRMDGIVVESAVLRKHQDAVEVALQKGLLVRRWLQVLHCRLRSTDCKDLQQTAMLCVFSFLLQTHVD